MKIKWINAAVNVVVDNVQRKEDNPPFICYDENMTEVARCHHFTGTDCAVVFKNRNGVRPPRVLLEVKGELQLDIPFGLEEPKHIVVPSSRGMYQDVPEPIRVDNGVYTHVEVLGRYEGVYDIQENPFMWVQCQKFEGLAV